MNERRHSSPKTHFTDLAHAAQLERDVRIANQRTVAELGPLPAGGLPVQPKRQPNLPKHTPPAPKVAIVNHPNPDMPPIPLGLQTMLKDYPEHLARLQDALNDVLKMRKSSTPAFEKAIWQLEGTLGVFLMEARGELQTARSSNDAEAIQKFEEKSRLMRQASAKGLWIGDEHLWNYFKPSSGDLE